MKCRERAASWLGLLLFSALACSGSDESPSTSAALATRSGFCSEWAVAACSAATVDACQASTAGDCQDAQRARCLELVPSPYAPEHASECLRAVRAAYADADLTATEALVVLELGAPCDRLVRGPGGSGASCAANADCDGSEGLTCVLKGAAEGSCELPEVMSGGLDCALPHQVCGAGFYCNGENCVARRRIGTACLASDECEPDAYCVGDGEAGECVARADVNTACSADEECLSGACFALASGERRCLDKIRLSPSEPLCEAMR